MSKINHQKLNYKLKHENNITRDAQRPRCQKARKQEDFRRLMITVANKKFEPRIKHNGEWITVPQAIAKEHWARRKVFGVANYSLCIDCGRPGFTGNYCLTCKPRPNSKEHSTRKYAQRNKEDGEVERKALYNAKHNWPSNFIGELDRRKKE